MLDQRRRRWAGVVQMLYKCLVLTGETNNNIAFCNNLSRSPVTEIVPGFCWSDAKNVAFDHSAYNLKDGKTQPVTWRGLPITAVIQLLFKSGGRIPVLGPEVVVWCYLYLAVLALEPPGYTDTDTGDPQKNILNRTRTYWTWERTQCNKYYSVMDVHRSSNTKPKLEDYDM